jgi:hypothetical protein
MLEGDISNRAKNFVIEWAKAYQEQLMDMRNTKEFRYLEGLE